MAASGPFEGVLGTGAMLNWISVAEGDLPIYEDWYNFQHLPERVSTPGFLRARRFAAIADREAGVRDHLTVYETEDADVLASEEYLRRLDSPTALTQQVVPLFRTFRRAVARSTSIGNGSSSRVLVLETPPGAVDPTALLRAAGTLIDSHRVHTASTYMPDMRIAAAKDATAEGRDSSQQTTGEQLVLLLEMQTGVDGTQILGDLVRDGGLDPAADVREYALLFELRSDPQQKEETR